MTRIWSVFPDTPYEISVTYLVTPVAIDSTREDTGAPVVDQIHEQGHRGAELSGVGSVAMAGPEPDIVFSHRTGCERSVWVVVDPRDFVTGQRVTVPRAHAA